MPRKKTPVVTVPQSDILGCAIRYKSSLKCDYERDAALAHEQGATYTEKACREWIIRLEQELDILCQMYKFETGKDYWSFSRV